MCVPPNEKAFRIQMMQCTTPPLVVGVHPLLLTLDGIHYVSTGKNITVLPPPTLESLHPTRGYFSGGTEVLIDGTNLLNTIELQCRFGQAALPAKDWLNTERVECVVPLCDDAMGGDPRGDACEGTVQVMLSFDGKDFFGNLTYEYARRQRVLDVLPFPAWRWDESTNVTLVGSGLSWPVYCRWLDLTITQALEVGTYTDPAIPAADSYAVCIAPLLPEERRLTNGVEIDSLLGSGTTLPCKGVFSFTVVTSEYDAAGQAPEIVVASYLSRDALRCKPLNPPISHFEGTGVSEVKVEVGLTPEAYSDSNKTVLTTTRPHIAEISQASGPFLGGNLITLHGTGFQYINATGAEEVHSLYVIIGDTPVRAEAALVNDTMVTDRLFTGLLELGGREPEILKEYAYVDVPIGTYYRPEVHQDGVPTACPVGHFCKGGFATPCAAGYYQNLTGNWTCEICPVGAQCGVNAARAPERCPQGYKEFGGED
ncbi:hypothetical protein Pmar_PMAR013631 [Perkinsus marinus ATCC 50983]|uniref:IPT/TIG domain-containing protein n=1 Tax=Perkinsus marinus (strain ATCC 50983 / TXsc) TaxID=423536 RepID=C5KP63_PERM5|nr:hypothetical protein Pmar_PMAR013631 [Perkinsus marinus ATCC 50983]EER13738.1 hypothetical protein Pmar_PMAR013631 [Perkinsus marinus ATCC 50983]|eukprot:XP_002781943.1 hypothetical protein Pmar_PMAR013631 [Perkinsus marinus ATCC 50983]